MQEGFAVWKVIYIAPSAKKAEQIQDRLAEEGFLAKIRHAHSARGQFEILVPESEVEEVQPIMGAILHL